MMIKAARGVLTLLALVVTAAAALAGPLQDADRLYRQRDYQGALRALRQAEREEPNNPSVYVALGATLRRLNDDNGAREAWDNVLRLDPELRSVRDDQGFLRAYRAVGGTMQPRSGGRQPTTPGGTRSRGATTPNPIMAALTQGDVYVAPVLKGDIDPAQLEQAARSAREPVKIVVTDTVYPYSSPTEMAARIREAMNLGEGVVVVGTPRRIGASSGRLSNDQISRALREANLNQAYTTGGLTGAMVAATKAVSGTVREDRSDDARNTGSVVLLGALGVGGFLGYRGLKKRRELETASRPVEALRRKVLDHLSYVDGYLDLLPAGPEADRARALRQSAYDEYAQAGAILEQAQTPDLVRRAQPMLEQALRDLEACRVSIDKATGGTGVAMSVPEIPSLATDRERAAERLKSVEEISDAREAQAMQESLEHIPPDERGVSFFSGRPARTGDLVPVTIVIDGQKRQVLATREEAEAIRRGETPNIRAFEQDGRYVPWYENRNYDPYRDYYGGWGMGGFGSLVNLYLLTSLFGGGMFGGFGFGGLGYGPMVVNNYYGGGDPGGGVFGGGGAVAEPPVEHAGGFDFFGQQGYDDTSASDSPFGGFFGGGDGGCDGGGGFFGGGDFGGGDFGGGDFGGGE